MADDDSISIDFFNLDQLIRVWNSSAIASHYVPRIRDDGTPKWYDHSDKFEKTQALYELKPSVVMVGCIVSVDDVEFYRNKKQTELIKTKGYHILLANEGMIYVQHNWLEKPGNKLVLIPIYKE